MEQTLTTPRKFTRLPTYDTRVWQTAIVYARALVGASEEAGVTDAIREEFDSLVSDVLDRLPRLEAVFASAFIDSESKAALLQKGLAGQASPLFLSFLQVVARHDRLDMLRLIHLTFEEEYNRVRRRVRVMVSTAEPLDHAAEQRIIDEVHKHLQLQPVLEKEIRPALIGGIVLRVGDRVYDGSVATQLEQLREQMIDRSVHEIQSRRDRFSLAE